MPDEVVVLRMLKIFLGLQAASSWKQTAHFVPGSGPLRLRKSLTPFKANKALEL